jgi:predicted nucleotidyltransferase
MSDHINKVRIKAVANALGELKEQVVFVGGATISLYPTREVFFEVRPTEDVDVIIEILNYSERARLEEQLRNLGFSHDIGSGVVCRYQVGKITVDIMPTNDTSIGFGNIWYPEGYKNAIDHKIDDRCTVKILTAPYFIATKLEAFKGRGKEDGRTSHDFEDIIYVLENRKEIWKEMSPIPGAINEYLQDEFRKLLNDPNIFEWVDGHVERGSPPATYDIIENIKEFTK